MKKIVLFLSICLFIRAVAAENIDHLINDNEDIVGQNQIVKASFEDTLIDIAVRHKLGYNLLRSANPEVDAWLPGEGTDVLLARQTILPDAPRKGIVINVPEMRLYFYTQDAEKKPLVKVYAISVGRGEWSTPIVNSVLVSKVKDPVWYPPETIRKEHAERGDILPKVVPAGPDNPLGQYLLVLDIPSYFIHGTNKKFGIGMQVTHGCIRMYPEDIEELATITKKGIPVKIINQPVKVGWQQDKLYLEAHRPLETANGVASIDRTAIVRAVVDATSKHEDIKIDWDKVEEIVKEGGGLPVEIGSVSSALLSQS